MDYLSYLKKHKDIVKVVVVGSGGVGKTSLLKVLRSNNLLKDVDESYYRTLFIEFEGFKINGEFGNRSIMILDVAGQLDLPIHPLKDFKKMVLGSVDLVVLMFSSDSMQSFLDLKEWYEIVKSYSVNHGEKIPQMVLVRNKVDLANNVDPEMEEFLVSSVAEIKAKFDLSLVSGQGLQELKQYLWTFDRGD